jgi:hypothetical protein
MYEICHCLNLNIGPKKRKMIRRKYAEEGDEAEEKRRRGIG